MADQFEMVQEDPPRALPEAYRDIKNNIERVKMSASGNWYRIAMFDTRGKAAAHMQTLKKRKEYALFEFKSGLLDPPDGEFIAGLWCKWIGKRKAEKHDVPSPNKEKLRAVPN